MQVSRKWLQQYVNIHELSNEKLSDSLTGCGLEVEGIEVVQNIKGGLEGLVVAKVVEKSKHPDSDHLSLTKVDYGIGELVQVVCGAANVATGQKVVFAPVGTKVYPINNPPFDIKKSKIRGQESLGMICAEDEIGLGTSHDGIMVLTEDAQIGISAAKYFGLENDTVIEVAILPNRCDAASHLGVARDLAATLNSKLRQSGKQSKYKVTIPTISLETANFPKTSNISIQIDESELCPRYSGLYLKDVTVGPSPKWLRETLEAVGQKSINNIVDITNYVLLETGQPLHAFDAETIKGDKVVIKKAVKDTKFVTLEGKERVLNGEELMICNIESPMVIAGVLGGLNAGVTNNTKHIFLESAYFNPVSVRKTSKMHAIKTDSSFRFERGTDPNATVNVLLRAADLICELTGATVASALMDSYPKSITQREVELEWAYLDSLIGVAISRSEVKNILVDLGFSIQKENEHIVLLTIPSSKNDVTRPADVAEEIIRIYGPNNIPMPRSIRIPADLPVFHSDEILNKAVAESLAANGANEAMNNSLTNAVYAEMLGGDSVVKILNPLSSELSVMRPSLVFGLLESVKHNVNRKAKVVKLFEFGKTYMAAPTLAIIDSEKAPKHKEVSRLGVIVSGESNPEHYGQKSNPASFYTLKKQLSIIADRLGLPFQIVVSKESSTLFQSSFDIVSRNKVIGTCGAISTVLLKRFEIEQEVYFAELNWDAIRKLVESVKIKFKEISRFPEVRRDLALLLNKDVKYSDLERLAFQAEKKLLKAVNIFDVFEGKSLPEGKKSYALSFILQDNEATLNEQAIEKAMQRLTDSFTREFGAELRQ